MARSNAVGRRQLAHSWCLSAALLLGLGAGRSAAGQVVDGSGLREVLATLAEQGLVGREPIRLAPQVAELYARSGSERIWTTGTAAQGLRAGLEEAHADGLDPGAYHMHAIDSLAALGGSAGSRVAAELDVLRTAALLGLVHDLRWGRARPPSLVLPDSTDLGVAARIVGSRDVAAAIADVRPRHFVYQGLIAALAQLRRAERAGGWAGIPAGPALREGTFDARVVSLRVRLAAQGFLAPDLRPSADFDAAVARAVQAFQHQHGLNEDGVVGRSTLAELNVPVRDRIAQVRVNLERARWITPLLPETFLVVNIAGAKLYLIRAGTVVHEARVIVGRDYTRTPTFSSQIRQVELNPSWTVPTSIVPEVLAAARRNPEYLASQGFDLLDRDGLEVEVDLPELLAAGAPFPWTFRQRPGPLNPLGGIKFTFPNPYSVYLHDTSAPGLFARETRLFSHGCIRVQDPLTLAELLVDRPEWSKRSLQEAIAAGSTEVVRLQRPVYILIQYWTASADEHGDVHFYRDVYRRDAAVLAALDR